MADEKKGTAARRDVLGTSGIGWSGIALRWVAALLLVMFTYNPSTSNYWTWISSWSGENLPLKVLVGLILATAYAVYFRATAGSLGKLGTTFFVAIFGVLMWLFVSKGIITDADGSAVWVWIFLVGLSIYLALGMTGSFIWKRLTGQLDIADGDLDHDK